MTSGFDKFGAYTNKSGIGPVYARTITDELLINMTKQLIR
jgi:hypothetical protein